MNNDNLVIGFIIFCGALIILRRFYVRKFFRLLPSYIHTYLAFLEDLEKMGVDKRFSEYSPHLKTLITTLPHSYYSLIMSIHLWGYRQMVVNKEFWDEMNEKIPFGWFLKKQKGLK